MAIPRNLTISGRPEDNDIDLVRKRIRLNNIAHKEFDLAFLKQDTQRYFKDVYEHNNPKHVRETVEGKSEPTNLYVIIDQRMKQEKLRRANKKNNIVE